MDETIRKMGENLTGVIKAVTREVIYEQELVERSTVREIVIEELVKIHRVKTDWSTDNAGQAWTSFEDFQLGEEWGRLISIIARKHKRTFGSIRSRIGDKIYGGKGY